LGLEQAGCVAGTVISGHVALDDATVALLRHERVPHRDHMFKVVEARPSRSDGTFALSVPDQMLPSASGERCELRYIVCARSEREAYGVPLVVTASAHPHVAGDPFAPERPLMSWDARHFHIELSDARLEGGGQLLGRVHRHGDWPPGEIVVTARCLECWRAATLAARGLPRWEFETLWERRHGIRTDPDSTWAPFEFELPQRLPPAVEATTLAWRYELITQRSVRYWFDETAAVTPLLHEGAALRRGGLEMTRLGGTRPDIYAQIVDTTRVEYRHAEIAAEQQKHAWRQRRTPLALPRTTGERTPPTRGRRSAWRAPPFGHPGHPGAAPRP
jgi:hypothetical protein